MEKKTILFAVNTEFVMTIALLYYENLKEKEGYYPVWFILKGNSNRFKDLNIDKLPGDKFEFWNNLNTKSLRPDLRFLKVLKNYKVVEFVHQHSLSICNILLEENIKKTNSNVIRTYISDSIGLSAITRKRIVKVSDIYLYYRKLVNGLYYLPNKLLRPIEYIKDVDNYINIDKIEATLAKFISFKEMLSKSSESRLLPLVFNFSVEIEYDIIFFTQPILDHTSLSQDVKERYVNVLDTISKTAELNQKNTLIKVHPGENSLRYKKYENRYCKLFENNNLPAELLFIVFSNKKVISCFSSISVLDFSQNNYHYWLYPLINHSLKLNTDISSITLIKDQDSLINILE